MRRQSDVVLTPTDLARIRPFGALRRTGRGDVLFEVGDADFPFVVLSGRTEIVDCSDGGEFVIKSSGPGQFDGELLVPTGRSWTSSGAPTRSVPL